MTDLSKTYLKRVFTGLFAAAIIGVAVVGACNTICAITAGFPLLSLWDDASPMQILIASAPFILLALLGVRARRPWIVALSLTLAFWVHYAYVITRPSEGGGANIGLGILMLFSPLPIAGASLLSLLFLAHGGSTDDLANGR